MDEPSTKLPASLLFMSEQLNGYNKNRFRLEPLSAQTATAGRIITVNLPENALLDMNSFRWHFEMDAGHNSSASCVGLIPQNADAVIGNLEVYVNGIQVQQSTQEYNTLAHTLRLGGWNQDCERTKGRLVNHAAIFAAKADTNAFDAITDGNGEKANLVIDQWAGFLNQLSTSYLPTDLIGQIQIRITLAPNSILSGCSSDNTANDLSAAEIATPPTYQLDNMYFTVDSIVVGDAYNQLLRNQLAHSTLPLNYNEYYSFTLPAQENSSHTNRFSLSSGSIDKILAINRDNSYNVFSSATSLAPSTTQISPLGAIGNPLTGHYFTLKSFKKSGTNDRDSLDGDLRYQFNVNNVQYPMYEARNSEAMADIAFCNDKYGMDSKGILVSSPTAFCRGQAVYMLQLNHPGLGLKCLSGYNSRGINSSIAFSMKGISSDKKDNTCFVQTTAQMRIGQGKQLAVSF